MKPKKILGKRPKKWWLGYRPKRDSVIDRKGLGKRPRELGRRPKEKKRVV